MDDGTTGRLTRRGVLAGTITAALAACTNGGGSDESGSTSSTTASTNVPDLTSDPFVLGVASGDPLADSVILWTRLNPSEPLPDEDIAVEWQVATDAEMSDIVAAGSGAAIAALGHSVHVNADGLEPETEYFYRFRLGEYETSPARTRTFAAPGTTPERFRFAFSSCQHWEQGYYAAYRDLVEEGDIDAFVFLGDYIYEYASAGPLAELGRTTGQDFECETLDQYRQRYALYKSDPLLQAAHALVPWIITWDDHEVENDYANDISEDDAEREVFLARRAAAYQAWYEHTPVRVEPPDGPDLEIYRSFANGDLVQFHVLDTRQYRADQQRGEPLVEALGEAVQFRDDTLAFSPEQTMLGEAQREWLLDGVASSSAIWDVIAQQVFMFGGNAVVGADPPAVVVDTWDGYHGERQAVLEATGDAADNLVVLTGDFHSAAVAELRTDPFDLSLPVVGTEFMASSISSSFFDDQEAVEELVSAALVANPQMKWFDARRGYTVCEVTPDRWLSTFRVVEDEFDEASPVDTASRWEVVAGTPGVVEVT